MISIEIPEIRPMSDLEKFVVGLKQLATICNVTSISGLEVHFGDGSYGGHRASVDGKLDYLETNDKAIKTYKKNSCS